MKKGAFNINRESIKKALRQLLSPAFLIILLGSFLMWYTTKLNDDYSSIEMPLNVYIDGQKYRITAVVDGRGSTIMAQRLSLNRKLDLTLAELYARPSRQTEGALTITPVSLQRTINAKIRDKDMTVVQIVDAPDFVPTPKTQPEKSDAPAIE